MHGFVMHCGYCGKAQTACQCGGTPAQSPLPAPVVTRARIVERYGERYCAVCGFPGVACGCDRPVERAGPDGAESSLAARVRQARSGR